MTRPLGLLVAIAVAGAGVVSTTAAHAGKWEAIERVPGQSPVKLLVEGKERNYFRIAPSQPLSIPVDGPAQIRIFSRAELAPVSHEVVSYSLRASMEGKEVDRQDTESSLSSQVSEPGGRHGITKSRRMRIDVPAGKHTVVLAVSGTPSLLVRLQQSAPTRGEEATVSLTPVEAGRSVSVLENEKIIPYYSVMAGKPIKLRVEGPTSLDLITRLDFDSSMRGTQAYRIAVLSGGKPIRELKFKTTKATTATYTNLPDRVPSKFDRTRLALAAGLQEITIELLDPKQGAAEVHARIPEPRVGDQE